MGKLSSICFLLILSSCFPPILSARQTTTDWKGFEKETFTFQDREAWVIKPKTALTGKPWVWRAHFPDWHTEMDSILVDRGFHIAYVNTNNLFGHPGALLIWDDFYEYLVDRRGFAPKVALEAVSRGGLYAYGWAKRNPEKVSCIYAEAPVCDPKSWPGGKGAGKGSPSDWEKWLGLYGFTETQALDFKDIPLEQLEGLAAYKVPVLHVVSLRDKIVPNEENTDRLIANYIKLGGPATVYPMTRGEQQLEGHHFKIEDPALFADFVQRHSYPVRKPLPGKAYIENNGGIRYALQQFEVEKKGTVAFLGGSITHNPGWRTKMIQYLQERFPDTAFEFISAGIPSLGSTPHAFRFGTDVLAKGVPDLLLVESAVNDRTNGFREKAQIRALEGICRLAYAANPKVDIVLMAFADPDKFGDYDAQKEPVEVRVHQTVARHYGFPFINLSQEVYDRVKAGEFSWKYDFKDLHPSPFGQELYFQSLKTLLRSQELIAAGPIRKLPELLDPFSYTRASYGSLANATKLTGFRIDPSWTPVKKVATRSGFVNVPMLVAHEPGASLTYRFKGKAVGIALVSGPDAGIITYQIDGKKPRKLDLFSQWSQQLHLPWYLVLDDELTEGNHTLTLSILPERNEKSEGSACRIVHFLVAE